MWIPPLLILPLIIYNVVGFGLFGVTASKWTAPVIEVGLISGGVWTMSVSDLILVAALVLLFFEIIKSARFGRHTVLDHMLSTGVSVIYLVEFLTIPLAATSLFFLCLVMSFIDTVSGFTVSIRSASRDVSIN